MKTAQMKICPHGFTPLDRDRQKSALIPPRRACLPLLTLLIAVCSYGTSSNLRAADSLAAADTVFRFQSKMAQRGHVASQYALAYMYESGQGTDKNLALAKDWYRQAAQQGFVPAQDRLVYIDILNNGYQQQKQQQWLLKLKRTADDYNHQHQGESAFLLAQLYAAGLAVNKSLTMAVRYFQLAEAANVIGSDSEIRRAEAELDALQQTYMPANSGTAQKSLQPDKPAADNKPAATAKPGGTINKTAGASANQPAVKTNNRAEVTRPKPRVAQPVHKTTGIDKPTAATGKNTQAATPGVQQQPAPAAGQNSKADQQEPHPMDLICSGWQRLSSACR
jgi:hypothetical protein